jgi:hypothetical protein
MIDNKKKTRIRTGNLMTPMGCATAHAAILRKLLKNEIDAVLATRLSQMFVAQRNILESTETERQIDEIKAAIDSLRAGDNRNVVQFKRQA